MDQTPIFNLPYPTGTTANDVDAHLKLLADKLEEILSDGVLGPIGSMRLAAIDEAHPFEVIAQGQQISRSAYPKYMQKVGVLWGSGDGSTTVNVPDMRDRVPLGMSGTKPIGSNGGADSVILAVGQLPAHNHPITDPGHKHTITNAPHNHGVSDPGHNHVINNPSHTHAVHDPGHKHAMDGNWGNVFTVNVGGSSQNDRLVSGGGGNITFSDIDPSNTGINIYGATQNSSANAANSDVTINNTTPTSTNSTNQTGVTVGNTGSGQAIDTTPKHVAMAWYIRVK